MKKFTTIFLEEAIKFLSSIEAKHREKIIYNIRKATEENDPELFKKLKGSEIWEFRTLYMGKAYRVLAFWDRQDSKDTLVVCSNGFIKKTQKTPGSEISKAEKAMKRYYEEIL